jgi:hypothetical protein
MDYFTLFEGDLYLGDLEEDGERPVLEGPGCIVYVRQDGARFVVVDRRGEEYTVPANHRRALEWADRKVVRWNKMLREGRRVNPARLGAELRPVYGSDAWAELQEYEIAAEREVF